MLRLFCLHVSRGCCVALPRGAMGLSAVCKCGISCYYSLIILNVRRLRLTTHVTHIKQIFFHFVVYLFNKIFLVKYKVGCK